MNTSAVLEFRNLSFKQIHIYHTNAKITLAKLRGPNGKQDKTELSGLRAKKNKCKMQPLSTVAVVRLVGLVHQNFHALK